MVANSASFVRPLFPRREDEARANVSEALARLATLSPPRLSGGDEAANDAANRFKGLPPSTARFAPRKRRAHALDDATLVRSALAGDRRAHDAIWARYVPLVRSKLNRSIGGQDVDDQVQEVFLRLFEYLDQLRDPSALRSFLIGITLRMAGTELRRRRCRAWLTLTATGDLPDMAVQDDPDTRRVVGRLFGILDKLTPESSRAFRLRYIEEKELTEVAVAMNVSLATAKRTLSRVSARVHAIAEREPLLAGYLAPA